MAHTGIPESALAAAAADIASTPDDADDLQALQERLNAHDLVIIDGCLVDPDTGDMVRVLGRGVTAIDQPWEPSGATDVEWVLRKAAAFDAQALQLKQRAATITSRSKRAAASCEFFKTRWADSLQALGIAALANDGKDSGMVGFDNGDLVIKRIGSWTCKQDDKERIAAYIDRLAADKAISAKDAKAIITRTTVKAVQIDVDTKALLALPETVLQPLFADRTKAETGIEVRPPHTKLEIRLPKASKPKGAPTDTRTGADATQD